MLIISLVLALTAIGYLLLNMHIYSVRRTYRHIKSPPISQNLTWFLGLLPDFKKRIQVSPNGAQVLAQYHHDFKWDLFVLPIFTKNIIFCMELEIIGKVLADWKTFPKDEGYKKVFSFISGVRIFGNYGLLSDPGTNVWYAKRRAMDPGFHKSFLKSIIPEMNKVVNKIVRHLKSRPSSTIFDICLDMNQSAFEAISSCGFNMSSSVMATHGNHIVKTVPLILQAMTLSMRESSFKYPWAWRKEKTTLKESVEVIRDLKRNLLLERIKSDAPENPDLMSHIINSNKCSDQLSIDDLVDDYLVFLIAGMETTAITMAITLFYLANNSGIFFKVRSEIDSVVKRGESMKPDDVNKLVYLEMVIKECLRMKPPVRAVGRCCVKDDVVVNGLKIPNGAEIHIPIMDLHHDSRYWENPQLFDPDRFSPDSKKKIKSFSYLPFAAGARSCIGKNFAILEAKMVVSRIVQEFDLVNPYPEVTDLKTAGFVTSRPVDGVNLKLCPRPQ
ncbi:hypothetical protein ACHWQZ_G001208 [Mnemiopsis leidyi]